MAVLNKDFIAHAAKIRTIEAGGTEISLDDLKLLNVTDYCLEPKRIQDIPIGTAELMVKMIVKVG